MVRKHGSLSRAFHKSLKTRIQVLVGRHKSLQLQSPLDRQGQKTEKFDCSCVNLPSWLA